MFLLTLGIKEFIENPQLDIGGWLADQCSDPWFTPRLPLMNFSNGKPQLVLVSAVRVNSMLLYNASRDDAFASLFELQQEHGRDWNAETANWGGLDEEWWKRMYRRQLDADERWADQHGLAEFRAAVIAMGEWKEGGDPNEMLLCCIMDTSIHAATGKSPSCETGPVSDAGSC